MGLDIRAFIDVHPKLSVDSADRSDLDLISQSSIQCFSEIYIERDSKLFALLAGVGHLGEEIKPLVLPRGLPTVYSWRVQYAYTVTAISDKDWTLGHGESSYPKYCKRSEAEEWIRNGESKHLNKALSEILDPDAHTFSWITREELEQIRDKYKGLEDHFWHSLEILDAVIALMKVLDNGQVGRARFVFWFIGGKAGEQTMINNITEQLRGLEF